MCTHTHIHTHIHTHTHTHTNTQSELAQEHNDAATAAAEFAEVELHEYKATIQKLHEEAAQVKILPIQRSRICTTQQH
jgi:hypothetical protein